MSYVYAEVDGDRLDPAGVAAAERVLAAARRQLDLPPLSLRWYVRSERAEEYPLTTYGRRLDVPDDRHLSGWYLEPGWIAVRADRPRHDRAVTICHEAFHAWQERHDKPLDEAPAEAFARRLVARLEGETR